MQSRTLPAGRGWDWIAAGWTLFKRAPGPWIAVALVGALVFVGMGVVPVIGAIATIVLTPVFTAGLMIGCRSLEQGRALELPHLFAGFRERFGTLAAVGGIYLAAAIVVALVVGLTTGTGLFAIFAGGEPDPGKVAAAMASVLLALLVMAALMLPVIMATWFAPALVVFEGMPALAAMQASFVGCLRNMVPFLVYGVVLLVAAVVASIPFGLGWLVLGPVLAASIYTSYKDIFGSGEEPAPAP